METSIYFDWWKNYDNNGNVKYENLGRMYLEGKCKHKEGVSYSGYCEKCDISEDTGIPIYNYLYPLQYNDYSEGLILKVVRETNLTVVQDTDTNDMFLSLCGCGMDLSQDIAKAYLILNNDYYNKIPIDILKGMSLQSELSISLKDFIKVTRIAKKEIKNEIKKLHFLLKCYKDSNKLARLKSKEVLK